MTWTTWCSNPNGAIPVYVGVVNPDAEAVIQIAFREEEYIVQEKVPLDLWAEDIPELDETTQKVVLTRCMNHRMIITAQKP